MAHKIAVLSQKGGTGKTTAVRHLADVFRLAGLDVLAIDLDPQGNLSDYFDVEPSVEPTIGDVLTGRATAAEAVHDGIIPSNLSLAEAELQLAGKMGRELTLRKALKDVDAEHDVILIDCPPALGLLTVNALVAADHALLSAEAQYFALQGVEQALEVIELARDGLNPDLEWLGVVFNIADMRTVHSREAYQSLQEHVGDKLLQTVIRQSIAYAESSERAVSILDHRADLGSDYVMLADELLGRLKLTDARRGSGRWSRRRRTGAAGPSNAATPAEGFLGGRRVLRGALGGLGGGGHDLRLVVELRQPAELLRQVPVALAQELHRGGQEDAPDDRRVDEDRDREAHADLLEDDRREDREDPEHGDHDDRGARHGARGAS